MLKPFKVVSINDPAIDRETDAGEKGWREYLDSREFEALRSCPAPSQRCSPAIR